MNRGPRRIHRLLSLTCLVAGALGALGAPAVAPAMADVAPEPMGPAEDKKLAGGGKTLIVPIQGDIDLGLASFVERVLKDAGPGDLVVFHINTFGGRIDAAVAIRDALLKCTARTVAFIDKRAISAGALISLAADDIVMTDGATIGAATPVELKGGEMAPVEAKVVSYFRKEMKATAEAKGRRGEIAEAMVDAAVVVDGLDDDESTLTLTTTEAVKHKIAGFTAESLDAVLKHYGRPPAASLPATLKPGINWAERFARFLSQPAISSLLMTLGMLGILIELWSPGHAVAGTLGVLCLLLFFFGHYVVSLAGLEEILLFVAGVVIVGFEVFFWPGHGMLAVLGVVMIVSSLVMALVGKSIPLDVSWSLGWITKALVRVSGSILATIAGMFVLARFLPRTRFGRALVLEQAITAHAGAASAQFATAAGGGFPPGTDHGADLLVGQSGIAATTLRPAGKIEIAGRRLDVVTEGNYLEAGTPVIVVSVDGARIVVRQAPADAASHDAASHNASPNTSEVKS